MNLNLVFSKKLDLFDHQDSVIESVLNKVWHIFRTFLSNKSFVFVSLVFRLRWGWERVVGSNNELPVNTFQTKKTNKTIQNFFSLLKKPLKFYEWQLSVKIWIVKKLKEVKKTFHSQIRSLVVMQLKIFFFFQHFLFLFDSVQFSFSFKYLLDQEWYI